MGQAIPGVGPGDVAGLVGRYAQMMDAEARAVAERLGITAGQVVALRELSEPLTLRELATRMMCEPPNATYIADRMQEQDLVERHPHPADRRAKVVVLTEAGRLCRRNVLDALSEHSPADALSVGEQKQLAELLAKIVYGDQ